MIETLLLVGLVLVSLGAVFLTIIRLPGTWIIVVAATGFSWHWGWTHPNPTILCVLVGLAIAAELIEMLASVASTRRAGASTRASWCALAGGFLGMIVFTLPLPIVGTIAGGALGCFIGAAVGELTVHDNVAQGARVGFFAAVGMVMGTVAKIMVAAVMAATAIVAAIWGRV